MTKLWNKIKIHPITLFIVFFALLSGLFKYVITIFSIVMIHELGHIMIAKIFKRKIIEIKILPFGGLVKIDALISSDIFEDLLIAIGGILFQLVFGLLIYIFNNLNIISYELYSQLFFYNSMIILFNMLPICPLDGYKMVKLFSELFLPFKTTFYTSTLFALILFMTAFLTKFNLVQKNMLVFTFLVFSTINEYVNKRHILNRFYVERMNRKFYFKKVSKIDNIDSMFKNRINIICNMTESEYLCNYYLCKHR